MADKGNATVAIYKSDYTSKMETLLSVTDTYETIKKDPLVTLQKNTYDLLKILNTNDCLNRKYNIIQLTQINTVLSRIYGLPKIHKNGAPLRPIVSIRDLPTEFLAKQMYNKLLYAIKQPKSYIPNSFVFTEKICNMSIPENHVLVSLDVKSLFTNVSLELIIDSIVRRYATIYTLFNIPLNILLDTVKFLMQNILFSFNDKFCRQKYGTPMGSPIFGLFADIVMSDLETECLKKLQFTPVFFFRYVDDIITCISRDRIDEMINIFNSYDERLQFTYEMEKNGSLSFLDVLLVRQGNSILTDWYTKPTFSGRLLNFYSKHPISQKIVMVYNLTDRAIKLSDKQFHNKNKDY